MDILQNSKQISSFHAKMAWFDKTRFQLSVRLLLCHPAISAAHLKLIPILRVFLLVGWLGLGILRLRTVSVIGKSTCKRVVSSLHALAFSVLPLCAFVSSHLESSGSMVEDASFPMIKSYNIIILSRGNFHTRNGWLVHSLSEIRNELEFQNWSQVSHFIVKGLVWAFYWPGKSWWFLTC